MKITNKIFTKKYGKWILSRKEEVSYMLLGFKISCNLVIGFGYFTAYEDEKIIVKTFMVPFLMIAQTYTKTITIINP